MMLFKNLNGELEINGRNCLVLVDDQDAAVYVCDVEGKVFVNDWHLVCSVRRSPWYRITALWRAALFIFSRRQPPRRDLIRTPRRPWGVRVPPSA